MTKLSKCIPFDSSIAFSDSPTNLKKLLRFSEFVNRFSLFFAVFDWFSHFIFQRAHCQKVYLLTVGPCPILVFTGLCLWEYFLEDFVMRKFAILPGAFALALVLVLSACGNGGDDSPFTPPTRVVLSVTADPSVPLPVLPADVPVGRQSVTVTATPSGARIFVTTNDTAPDTTGSAHHASPFTFPAPANADTSTTPHGDLVVEKSTGNVTLSDPGPWRGHAVVLRAIGMELDVPGLASLPFRRTFQMFTPATLPATATGPFSATVTENDFYGNSKPVTVTLTVANGNITQVAITPATIAGYSEEYWARAVTHSRDFLLAMNSAEFDVRTGSTISSRHIRLAAQAALDTIDQ